MTRFVSKQEQILKPASFIYNFLVDFNNLKTFLPPEVSNWESGEDFCKFDIQGIGAISMKIVEKKEFNLIKVLPGTGSDRDFKFWIQLKKVEESDTRIKLTFDIELNAMYKMMVKKPLEKFINTLAEKIADGFNSMEKSEN